MFEKRCFICFYAMFFSCLLQTDLSRYNSVTVFLAPAVVSFTFFLKPGGPQDSNLFNPVHWSKVLLLGRYYLSTHVGKVSNSLSSYLCHFCLTDGSSRGEAAEGAFWGCHGGGVSLPLPSLATHLLQGVGVRPGVGLWCQHCPQALSFGVSIGYSHIHFIRLHKYFSLEQMAICSLPLCMVSNGVQENFLTNVPCHFIGPT